MPYHCDQVIKEFKLPVEKKCLSAGILHRIVFNRRNSIGLLIWNLVCTQQATYFFFLVPGNPSFISVAWLKFFYQSATSREMPFLILFLHGI